jgi:glucosamine--fructose-6-phosphate aminotransferase (isomerizing)
MCGIFGAENSSKFETLYDINKVRGTFAFGSVTVTPSEHYLIHKQEGIVNFNEFSMDYDTRYITGHTQAPTSCERKYADHTSHPFEAGEWMVAHNGIISNFSDLKKEHAPWHSNKVDSSIIPTLLNEFYSNSPDMEPLQITSVISKVLSMLKGTFAVWILNRETSNIYIARSGSTLFFDKDRVAFSSIECMDWEPVQEGIIYQYTIEGFTQVGTFDCDHPFFIL